MWVTHACLTAICLGLPGWAGTRKVKLIWILLKQETVSRSGISWAVCKSAPRSRQITMPTPHHSVFYRLDALPAAQPNSVSIEGTGMWVKDGKTELWQIATNVIQRHMVKINVFMLRLVSTCPISCSESLSGTLVSSRSWCVFVTSSILQTAT